MDHNQNKPRLPLWSLVAGVALITALLWLLVSVYCALIVGASLCLILLSTGIVTRAWSRKRKAAAYLGMALCVVIIFFVSAGLFLSALGNEDETPQTDEYDTTDGYYNEDGWEG